MSDEEELRRAGLIDQGLGETVVDFGEEFKELGIG